MGLTLDTGALIALERVDPRVELLIRSAELSGRLITVPAPVLAQFWRGQWMAAEFAGILREANVESTTTDLARRAGELLGRTGTSDAIDAIVACSAAARGDVIVTSDPHDMQRLADDLRSVRVVAI